MTDKEPSRKAEVIEQPDGTFVVQKAFTEQEWALMLATGSVAVEWINAAQTVGVTTIASLSELDDEFDGVNRLAMFAARVLGHLQTELISGEARRDVGLLLDAIPEVLANKRQRTERIAMGVGKAVAGYELSKRRQGGKAKAANAKPNPEKLTAIELARAHPELSATQIKTRAKLRASDRTIRGWIAEVC